MPSFTRFPRRRRRPDLGPLLQVPAFRHLAPRQLAKMAPHTDRLRLPAGRVVIRAGEPARELVVIVAGEATIEPPPRRPVAALGPGAQIGGWELVCNERHAATIVARSDLEVVVVHGRAVRWAQYEGVASLDLQARAPSRGGHSAGSLRPLASRADSEPRRAREVGAPA